MNIKIKLIGGPKHNQYFETSETNPQQTIRVYKRNRVNPINLYFSSPEPVSMGDWDDKTYMLKSFIKYHPDGSVACTRFYILDGYDWKDSKIISRWLRGI